MQEFLLFMHNDTTGTPTNSMWDVYLTTLQARGAFRGGSGIGAGEAIRRDGAAAAVTEQLVGFIRLQALDLAEARTLVRGNPVYECGGTVELRALPED
ncbi:MAG: YciI family protein [Sphingomonas sp.]